MAGEDPFGSLARGSPLLDRPTPARKTRLPCSASTDDPLPRVKGYAHDELLSLSHVFCWWKSSHVRHRRTRSKDRTSTTMEFLTPTPAHLSDQTHQLGIKRRSSRLRPSFAPSPAPENTISSPAQYRGRFGDDEGLWPAIPDSGRYNPKESISIAELRPASRALHDHHLMRERQVLEYQI